MIPAPTREEARQLQHLADEIARREDSFRLTRRVRLRGLREVGEDACSLDETGAMAASPWAGGALRFERKLRGGAVSGQVEQADGRVGRALSVRGRGHVQEPEPLNYDYDDAFGVAAWVEAESPDGVILSRSQVFDTDDERAGRGITLALEKGKLKLKLIGRMDDWIIVSARAAFPLHRWTHVAATYDGSLVAAGVTLYIDGVEVDTVAELDYSNLEIDTKSHFESARAPTRTVGLSAALMKLLSTAGS